MRASRPVGVLVALVAVAACGEGSRPQACATRGAARLCVVRERSAFHVEGHGLRPGSAVKNTSLDDGNSRVPTDVTSVGANGEYPDGGVVGLTLGRARSARLRLSAVTQAGDVLSGVFTLTRNGVKVEPDAEP